MIPTAFMGYVLPWGQMSYWAATVVISMFTAVPVVGEDVVAYIRGAYEVGNPTLTRFYALHFFLPFVIAAVAAAHVWALHAQRSNNPLGIEVLDSRDVIPFHPFFTIQDMVALAGFLLVLAGFVFFAPDLLTPAENFQPADPLSTPHLIVPEWYLLPFYAMLKAIPFKVLGIVAMLARTSHQGWVLRCGFGEADARKAAKSVWGHTVEPPDAAGARRNPTLRAG